jgi:hypothetical protein
MTTEEKLDYLLNNRPKTRVQYEAVKRKLGLDRTPTPDELNQLIADLRSQLQLTNPNPIDINIAEPEAPKASYAQPTPTTIGGGGGVAPAGGGYTEAQTSITPTGEAGGGGLIDRETMITDLVNDAADIVEAYLKTQENALAEIGSFKFDEAAAREEALKLNEPYFKDQQSILDRQIKEGQITTVDDYNYRRQQIQDEAAQNLREISITEAETNEQLKDRLTDIGATTAFNLNQARQQWDQTIFKDIQAEARQGRGFSGVMKEQLTNLRTQKEQELAEIQRRGGVAEQTEQRTAKYDLAKAQAARQTVQEYQTREGGRAGQIKTAGERQFGVEGGAQGYVQTETQKELERAKETLTLQEVEQRRQQAREDFTMAQQLATQQAPYEFNTEELRKKLAQRANI